MVRQDLDINTLLLDDSSKVGEKIDKAKQRVKDMLNQDQEFIKTFKKETKNTPSNKNQQKFIHLGNSLTSMKEMYAEL